MVCACPGGTHAHFCSRDTFDVYAAVLFKEISVDLGMNLVQVGAVWGLAALPGIFTGMVGGSLGDRFGAKQTLMITCLLSGAAGALRGLSDGFISLAVTIFLSGFLFSAIPMNVHKICSTWFSGRQLGLPNGVVSTGMALGFMTTSILSATVLSPLLGGWRGMCSSFMGPSQWLSAYPGHLPALNPVIARCQVRMIASHHFGSQHHI